MSEFRDKLLTIGYMKGGRTRPKVREFHRPDGVHCKSTTDELGNTVTEHATKDDRVDVMIRPQTIHVKAKADL